MSPNSRIQKSLPIIAAPLLLAGAPAAAGEDTPLRSVPLKLEELGGGAARTGTGSLLRSLSESNYQVSGKGWKARLYTGIVYDEHARAAAGPRDVAGLMIKAEALTNRPGSHFATPAADFAERERTYRLSASATLRAGPVFVGPEATLIGSDYYTSRQVGLVVDDIKLGDVRFSLHGGYSFGSDRGRLRDSPYAGFGASLQF